MRCFASFVLLLLTSVSSVGQSAPNPANPDYSKQGFVVESLRTVYRFENDGTGNRDVSVRVKLQSEAGVRAFGQLVFGYNSANERIEISHVRVIKADGTVVNTQPDAIQDLATPISNVAPVYTDFRQKHVTVPSLRPNEILEYETVTSVTSPLAVGQFWMQHDFGKFGIILDEQLEVDVPASRKIKLKTKSGFDPKISEAAGRRVYRWTSSNLKDDDEDANDKKNKKDKKKPRPSSEPEAPAIQLTTFASWEEVGRWYADLERDRRAPSDEIRAKAALLIAGKTSDLDKIGALYDFVAGNYRYVSLSFGVGRYQPHAAKEVLQNQYGDCKDKHTLLASLLEAAGFHASTVLINSSRKLDPEVPSPSQFDHVITLVALPNDKVWMDTTTEVAPFRLLAFNLRKKQALVIPPTGPAHLEETPADTPMPNREVGEIDGKVSDSGKLEATIKLSGGGDVELGVRSLLHNTPRTQWKRMASVIGYAVGVQGDVDEIEANPESTHAPFEMTYKVTKDDFVDWTKKELTLEVPLGHSRFQNIEPDDSPDAEPIKLGGPLENVYRTRLLFPTKYTIRIPLSVSVKRDYAEYSATYSLEGNVFTAERRLLVKVREIPAARVTDYLAFVRTVTSDSEQQLSLVNKSPGISEVPKDLSADDLNSAGDAAMKRGEFQTAIDLLKRAVEAEPKHKWAWNNLGNAYLASHKTDEAIVAFKKQIEINAYDEYAYNNLGRAYWTKRSYSDAAAAFQKQLEINPLDKFAHANLGRMYAEEHKYDQALPELQKAESISPDDAFLKIILGDAYLNLGKDDEASAAFKRAADLQPVPPVWNNIAYQLALKGVHLDEAEHYAQSAVTTSAVLLSNLTLEQLDAKYLPSVRGMAAFWDTLGWVYFAKGDLDKAEKYVTAAWQLTPAGEISDHLGQIYEKEGRKEDAIRAYAIGMWERRPPPELRGRLIALLGGESKLQSTLEKYRSAGQDSRTIRLGKIAKQTGSADFFVMLANRAGNEVEGVKFVSGDEKLKPLGEALRTAKYNMTFPDSTTSKVFRRGVLSCSMSTGECDFVMMLPEDVVSAD